MPQYELNLSDYYRIIRKRRWIIASTFVISVLMGFYSVTKQPVYYVATATVKLNERKTVAGLLTEWITTSPGDMMTSESNIIKGFPVVKRAAEKLGLINEHTPEAQARSLVSELQGSISTQIVENTNIIEIIVTGDEPKKVMDLANAVTDAYVMENLLSKNEQARTTRQFIEEQLAGVESRLQGYEESLRKIGLNVKNIQISPAIQQKLTELAFQLSSLQQKYTDKHPMIKQIKDQMAELEAQLKGFSGQELDYSRLNREIDVNKKLYSMLKEKLEEARINEAQKVPDVSKENPATLPAPVTGQKKSTILVGGVLGIIIGVGFAFVIENMDTSIGTIEDVENLVKLPVLGVIPSGAKKKGEQDSAARKIYAKFRPPKVSREDEYYNRLIVHYDPRSIISEAYRAIITNLKVSPTQKTFLFTSSAPAEGKTSTLTNVGLAMAQTGLRVMLVSTDLRRPRIASSFGLKKDVGLTEVVTRVVSLDEAICSISDFMLGEIKLDKIMMTPGMENIFVLPAGHLPDNPVTILESQEMQRMCEELRNRFDVVLYDAPPILPVADATLLAAKVDAAILVYEAGRTARSALIRSKMQLQSTGVKVLGVILNHIRSNVEVATNYPYYYKYYTPDKSDQSRPAGSKFKNI